MFSINDVRKQTERAVCALVARGNVSLQRGEYITQDDMNTLQEELERYYADPMQGWGTYYDTTATTNTATKLTN